MSQNYIWYCTWKM